MLFFNQNSLLAATRYLISCFTFFLVLSFIHAKASPLHPDKLSCEYIKNPLGIAEKKPRLTWTLISPERNQQQSGYEIIVSDDKKSILKKKGKLWETGKVTSAQNVLVEYRGAPLKSFTRYYWIVRVYNQQGEVSEWSQPAWFETAMLNGSDWAAQWIGDGKNQFENDTDFYGNDQMPLFRKSFDIKKKITSASLYISGLGYYVAYLNGKKIGDHVLDPGWTTYGKQAFYVTYDVSDLLQNKQNTIGVKSGNGWYNPLPLKLFGRFNLREVQQTGRPCLKAQLLIRYTDGSSEAIITDEKWQTANGPVLRNNVYLGEHYDARLELANWSSGADNNLWKNAVIVPGPSGELVPQMQPPVRITKVINPISVTETGKDTFIVDMGQNFAGVARIRVKGPAGKRVVMRYGEDLFNDGRLNLLSSTAGQIKQAGKGGPGAPEIAWQEDSYILKGSGIEQWEPNFTFHGFRFVEITGWPGKPAVTDIEGLRMNTDLATSGTFQSSNDMFNRLQETIKWTFLSNVFSVQSDCPAREKMGYGADIVVSCEAFLYNYDMAQFTTVR